MATPKDKELSTNPETKRAEDFQDRVDIKENAIEVAHKLLVSTTEDAFEKMGFEKSDKIAGFYGTGKSYGAGTDQNKFGVRVAGVTKSSLEKQVMLGTKRIQSDINFQYNGKMVSVEYKTTEAGAFRGVDSKAIPYSFTKTINVDGSKKSELEKNMKELFAEAAKKEVGYLTNTRLGVDDKLDKSTTSIVKENKKPMNKLTLKSIFSENEEIFGTVNESKENIQQVKDANTIPLANVSPYDKGEKKAPKDKFLFLDKNEQELQERAEKSGMAHDKYIEFVKREMKDMFGTDKLSDLTHVEKKEFFNHLDDSVTSKEEKSEELNEDGGPGVTSTGPAGSGAGAFLTKDFAEAPLRKGVKETAYGKQKANKRPTITQEYKAVPNSEGYKNENFWTTVPQSKLDNLKHPYAAGVPGMEGIKPGSDAELKFASKGLVKNGPKGKMNESIEPVKANLDLTKKKIFSLNENKEKGINKRYLVTEKTSEEYLKDRWKKLTNFKVNESINENLEINNILNECDCQNKKPLFVDELEFYEDSENSPKTKGHEPEAEGGETGKFKPKSPVEKLPNGNLEETVSVQKPGSLFGIEYVFYKKDFLNEDKKYILDLSSRVFVPNPNIK